MAYGSSSTLLTYFYNNYKELKYVVYMESRYLEEILSYDSGCYLLPDEDGELKFYIDCHDYSFSLDTSYFLAEFNVKIYIEYGDVHKLIYKKDIKLERSYVSEFSGFTTNIVVPRRCIADVLLNTYTESDENGLKPFNIYVEIKSDRYNEKRILGYGNEEKQYTLYFLPNELREYNIKYEGDYDKGTILSDIFKVDIEYIKLPSDIIYRQFSTQPGIDEIKSITISLKNNDLFNILKDFYNINITIGATSSENFKEDYETRLFTGGNITFTREDIYATLNNADVTTVGGICIYAKETLLPELESALSNVPLIEEREVLYQTTRGYTGNPLSSSYIGEGYTPLICMNKDVQSVVIGGKNRMNYLNGKQINTQTIRASNTLLVEYGNVYCDNLVFEPSNVEYDLDKIFCSFGYGTSSYTFKGGVTSSYASKLPHSSLSGNSFALTVKSPGLHILDNGDIQVVATQLIEMDHDVTNSSGSSKVAYSRFSRGITYLNGNLDKTAWYHEETYDSDGNLYYFNELTGKFTQR